jgi:hypothetical protein
VPGGGVDDASSAAIIEEDLVHTTSVRAGLVTFAAQDYAGVGWSSTTTYSGVRMEAVRRTAVEIARKVFAEKAN